jgi:hypothetical protein
VGSRIFSSRHRAGWSGAHPTSIQLVPRALSRGLKRSVCKAAHLLPTSTNEHIPWPLVRKQTIPVERESHVGEVTVNLFWSGQWTAVAVNI